MHNTATYTELFERAKTTPWTLGTTYKKGPYAVTIIDNSGINIVVEPQMAFAEQFDLSEENVTMMLRGKTLIITASNQETLAKLRNAGFQIPEESLSP